MLMRESRSRQRNRIEAAVCALLAMFTVLGSVHGQVTDTLRMTFVGDILLDRGVRQMMDAVGSDALFTPSVDALFRKSNVVVANLECPATKIKSPVNKRFIFRAEPKCLEELHSHGITHLCLANNHSIDQGREGLVSTIENIRRAGMVPFGAGIDAHEACTPVMLATIPRKVYLLSSVQLALENFPYLDDRPCPCQLDFDSLVVKVAQLHRKEPQAYIVVMLHWGGEHTLQPTLEQRFQAHRIVDAGADCLICHHTHTLQTVEIYRDKPIYYSIGNFIFDQHRPLNTEACAVNIKLTKTTACVKTLMVSIDDCRPTVK